MRPATAQSAPSVVLLMGPTSAGKTRLSFELAERFELDVVSVDSAMVYRGLDIGTAKPSVAERARVPHHLIDIRNPAQSYSAGHFVRDAGAAIEAILAAGRLPVLVGGTMLYFHALLNGLAELPEGDPGLRAQIDEEAARRGWAELHEELAAVDPVAAGRIHPNDPQRIQRALEVYRRTGQPISALQSVQPAPLSGFAPLSGLRMVPLVADVPDRAVLHSRIAARFDSMMRAGFLEEVRALHGRGDLRAELPALRAVGYRQLWGHLEGQLPLEEAVQRAVVATRQLAKRQMTWLRALSRAPWGTNTPLHWIDVTREDAAAEAIAIVRTVAVPNFS